MWFELSLFFALWTSIGMLIAKRFIKDLSPTSFYIITLIFTLPFLTTLLLILGVPSFTKDFFILLFVCSILDTIAGLLYYKALSISEISLIAPISSFNPVFVLVFGFFLLHENPTPIKFLGILIIVLGSYLLNISSVKSGILKPFSKLFSDRGVQLFLVTNLIWGLTPVFQKKAIFETTPNSPLSVPLMEAIFILIFLIPILLRAKDIKKFTVKNIKWLIFFGVMTTFAQFSALSAFALANVAYVSAVFKLSTLFSVILGAVFFNEKGIKERLLGASVMVLGTLLLAF